MVDPCFYCKVKQGEYFFLLVHVDDYACAVSRQSCIDAWLQHWGVRGSDDSLDVKLLGDVETYYICMLSGRKLIKNGRSLS